MLFLSACAANQNIEQPQPSTVEHAQPIENPMDETESNVKEQQHLTLTFYYVDEELLFMKEKEQTISYFNEEEKWTSIWKHLQHAGDEDYISLWEHVELIAMEVDGQQLNINISKPENLQFGSTAEGFAIQTLLQTVGQLEGIQTVQLLIDGEIHETLAGHVSIDQPIPTDEMIYRGE